MFAFSDRVNNTDDIVSFLQKNVINLLSDNVFWNILFSGM